MTMTTNFRLARWLLLPALLAACLCATAAAEPLAFDALLHQAVQRSFTLKISRSDTALRHLDLDGARSLYLPTLALRYDLGYAWALADSTNVVTIGDTVSANDLSTWQNSLSLSASLLLYDFGAREQRVAGARQRVQAAELGEAEALQQVREAVLDAFVRGLQAQQRVRSLTEILARRRQQYRDAGRLLEAGTAGRVQVQNAALQLAAALTRLDDARVEQVQALAALTELTGEGYPPGDTVFSPLPAVTDRETPAIVVEALPQVRVFDAELAQLRAEGSALRRELLPSFGLSGSYRLYGADRGSFGRTLGGMADRDATVALVARWEFYSGGRSRLQLARIEEQRQRLSLQRQQRIAELERQIGGLRQAVALASGGNGNLQQRRQAATLAAEATARLRGEGVLDQTAALEREVELLEDELEAELLRLKQQADSLRLRFWQEEAGS